MSDSYVVYAPDGATTVFTIPFPYLEQSDVAVLLDGMNLLSPADYTWLNAGSIKLTVAPEEGSALLIRRSTSPDTRLVAFANGAVLTADDLNTATLQVFYRTQELQDAQDNYIISGVNRYFTVAAPTAVTAQDLLNAAADAALQTTIAQALLAATTDIETNANSILAQTTRVDTLQATLDSLTSSVPGGIGTYLTNETNSRIAGDAALASTFDLMGAVSGTGAVFVLNTASVYVDAVTSVADKFAGIESTIAGNTAAITSEASTRAAADSALSTTLTGLTSTVSGNSAAIASEATTRASADSANATAITALTTTVSGNTASIASQLTSIDGLQAQYTLRIDANGNVAGFGLAAGGGSPSEFTVLANKFSVIDPGAPGGTPTIPFSVSGGVVFMQNVVIGGALIQDLTVSTAKITDNAVTEFYSANESPVPITKAYNVSYEFVTSTAFTPSVPGTLIVMGTFLASASAPTCLVTPEAYIKQNGTITYVQPAFSDLVTTGVDVERTVYATFPVVAGQPVVFGLRGIPNGANSAGSWTTSGATCIGVFVKK